MLEASHDVLTVFRSRAMGYPPQPNDPYQQSGPQYPQPYQPQPYSQPLPVPQYGPVQMVSVRGFNPVTAIVHGCLWVFVHWWMAIITIGFWLLVAIPVTFIGWRVKRPVQQIQHPYPPQIPPGY
jgi:hypothetical protein